MLQVHPPWAKLSEAVFKVRPVGWGEPDMC